VQLSYELIGKSSGLKQMKSEDKFAQLSKTSISLVNSDHPLYTLMFCLKIKVTCHKDTPVNRHISLQQDRSWYAFQTIVFPIFTLFFYCPSFPLVFLIFLICAVRLFLTSV